MSSAAPDSDHPFAVPGLQAEGRTEGEPVFGRELLGRLPCARCRYELQGLSVAANCPECGLPIGVTILAVVDPFAKEIQPIPAPRLVVAGMLLWAGGAFLSAISIWIMRVAELFTRAFGTAYSPSWTPPAILILTFLSALGATVLIRPHAKIPRWQSWAAVGGVLAYIPLLVLQWRFLLPVDGSGSNPSLWVAPAGGERVLARAAAGVLGALIVLGLRPNARVLVARSLVLRTGRVDRQTLFALAAAFGVGALGDLMRVGSMFLRPTRMEILENAGLVLVVLGGILSTIGLAGVLLDSWRIRRAVLSPPIALSEVVGPSTAEPAA